MRIHSWPGNFLRLSLINNSGTFASTYLMGVRLLASLWGYDLFIGSWSWWKSAIISLLFTWECESTLSCFFMRIHTRTWYVCSFFLINNTKSLAGSNFVGIFLSLNCFIIFFVASWPWSNCWVVPSFLSRKGKSSFFLFFVSIHTWSWQIVYFLLINYT